jgi:hypothetical protein
MDIQWIVIFLFVLGMVIMAILYRKSTLKHLEEISGEEIHFEETGRRVHQKGSPRSTLFINCLVRVTTMRIIIAQKVLLGNTFALRHVIDYRGFRDETDLRATLTRGYLIMKIDRSDVKITSDPEETRVRIDIPESGLTRGQYIEFVTERGEDYRKIFL